MKRIFCLLLIVSLIFCFFGCSEPEKDSVMFFYLRREFTLGDRDSVIASESREFSPGRNTLEYILGMYLGGPLDDSLESPFPSGTQLISCYKEDKTLTLVLNDAFGELSGMRRTLAAGCIARTCFALSDAEAVQIQCGNHFSITLTPDTLTLWDSTASPDDPQSPTP